MPIQGTYNDYDSTRPWNDPFNPWPIYSQVSISAVDVPFATYDLEFINPYGVIPNLSQFVAFLDTTVMIGNYLVYEIGPFSLNRWTIYAFGAGSPTYSLVTNRRSIPLKQPNGANGWTGSANVSSVYIQPVTTSLTLWEKRRIRLLEYC